MTKDEQQLHLNNIANGIAAIHSEISGLSLEQFKKEEQIKEAVYSNLQMIGEAAHELADNSSAPEGLNFPTDILASFRNARYNQEAEIDETSIWSVIHDDLEIIREEALRSSARIDVPE